MDTPITAVVFGVDGVLLDLPHERAWREALAGMGDPRLFTHDLYRERVVGRTPTEGGRAILTHVDAPEPIRLASFYAARKQARLNRLLQTGLIRAFADAFSLARGLNDAAVPLAAVTTSPHLDALFGATVQGDGQALLSLFDTAVGRTDMSRGALCRLAAEGLHTPAYRCLIIEADKAGVAAASALGAAVLGVARLEDPDDLLAAGADMVVQNLNQVDLAGLIQGRLRRKR